MRQKLGYQSRTFQVTQLDQMPYLVRIKEDEDQRELELQLKELNAEGRVEIDGTSLPYFVTHTSENIWVTLDGQTFCFARLHGEASEPDAEPGDFKTPMPGKVIDVLVVEGQEVKKGEALVLLEAMKMEHRVEAPVDGVVSAVFAEKGQLVSQGFKLIDFIPSE